MKKFHKLVLFKSGTFPEVEKSSFKQKNSEEIEAYEVGAFIKDNRSGTPGKFLLGRLYFD